MQVVGFLTPVSTVAIISIVVCGCRQAVRQQLPKLPFVGSNPITRSFLFYLYGEFTETISSHK